MVGNDVVDLGDREVLEGPTHPRFDDRVFGAEERRRIRESSVPGRTRWVLWAAKEAAFKLARKCDPRVVFSPRRFGVSLGLPGRATVRHEEQTFSVRIATPGHALHALALEPSRSGGRFVWAVEACRPGDDPSRAARSLAARVLAEEIHLPQSALHFEKQGRIPSIRVDGRDELLDLSISHHGRYVAFASDLGASV